MKKMWGEKKPKALARKKLFQQRIFHLKSYCEFFKGINGRKNIESTKRQLTKRKYKYIYEKYLHYNKRV